MKLLKSSAFWRRIAIVVLLTIVFIRPTFSSNTAKRESTNLNIWFLVDATNSMTVKDVDGGSTRRYEKVQSDMESIIKSVPGAKYGLIVEDFTTYSASPLSSDSNSIVAAKSYVIPKSSFYSQPTALSELLGYAKKNIKANLTLHPERNNVVVFMSDGEDFSGSDYTSQSGLSDIVKSAIVFGYGSSEGGLINQVNSVYNIEEKGVINENQCEQYYYRYEDYGLTKDSNGCVLSKIDEGSLKKLATSLSGDYYHREGGDVPASVTEKLKSSATAVTDDNSETSAKKQLYWIFAIFLLGLLLWEGEELIVRILLEKEKKHD